MSSSNRQAADATGAHEEASPLHALLRQVPPTAVRPGPGQVILGVLQAIPAGVEHGAADVAGLGRVAIAHSLVPLKASQVGHGVALSVLEGGMALVLGTLWNGEQDDTQTAQPSAIHDVLVDGRQHVIEAQQSIELRCGEAAIVLTADGRIQLRGTYITSQASATQRVLGGSIHFN